MAKIEIDLFTRVTAQGKLVDSKSGAKTGKSGDVVTVTNVNDKAQGKLKEEPFTLIIEPTEALALFGKTFPEIKLEPGKSTSFNVTGPGKLRLRSVPPRPGHDHEDAHIIC